MLAVSPEATDLGDDAEANATFTEALRNNQRGDNYTLLTVLFAAMLGCGFVLCMVGIVFLVSFPELA